MAKKIIKKINASVNTSEKAKLIVNTDCKYNNVTHLIEVLVDKEFKKQTRSLPGTNQTLRATSESAKKFKEKVNINGQKKEFKY